MSWLSLLGIVLFAVGLIFSVAFHESGHLAAGKLFDVKVTQYMVGFGRTLWSRRKGETEYGLKAIPAGGYCRLVGMLPPGPDDEPGQLRTISTGWVQTMVRDARSAAREEVAGEDLDRVFYRKPWWQKLIIMVSGVAANFVLAFVLVAVAVMGFGVGVVTPTVSRVSECVLPVDTKQTSCQASDPQTPAAQAGFRAGDQIVTVDGAPVKTWKQATTAIRASSGPTEVVVQRGREQVTLRPDIVTNKLAANPDSPNPTKFVDAGFLGVAPTGVLQRKGIGGAVEQMGSFTSQSAKAVAAIPSKIGSLWHAAFGGTRDVNSPVGIVGAGRIGGEIASADLSFAAKASSFLLILAGINMALGLINLVPLLPLDGGHAIGAVWEGIKRAFAKVFHRPEPKPVDVARLLPLAYGMAMVLIAFTVLLVWVDLVNPVRLPT